MTSTLPPKLSSIIQTFFKNYLEETERSGIPLEQRTLVFQKLIELVTEQIRHPHKFALFHTSIRAPFDYYQFGLDFIRPLIDFKHSQLRGLNHVKIMVDQLSRGENVILLANHQTEPDPQIISLLLEAHQYAAFASHMIFVAGHRVIEDPMAIPMSMGRNLLCIYSKKHIDNPPEEKPKKVSHNQRTMKKMTTLLSEGGKCIYVAPSGGRDRPDAEGKIEIAPFDPQSIEMFRLMAQKAKKPTHFYPLALSTFALLPPPDTVEKELGEHREAHYGPVQISFGDEIDFESVPHTSSLNKKEIRDKRAEEIWKTVCRMIEVGSA